MTTYAVIEVGCTECWTTSSPDTRLVTDDFAKASAEARQDSEANGRQGDAFVIRLDDGAIVAYAGGDFGDTWIENLDAEAPRP